MTQPASALAPSPVHFEIQPTASPVPKVKWGGKEYRIELINVTAQGTEVIIPLSQQDLQILIPKIEQALVKMQRANLDPAQVRQVDICWRAKVTDNRVVSYSYEETAYYRNQEPQRHKVPLIINGKLERNIPELKALDDFLLQKLTPVQNSTRPAA